MYNYSGIKPEIVELLSINRFNDSKEFYEEHKEELKQGATIPMRQIVLDLSDLMRRNKVAYPFAPFYWFEFLPAGYAFGLGMWTHKPSQFDAVRQKILEEPERWLEAVKATEDAGLTYGTRDYYKKDKVPDAPEALKQYLNAKNMEFVRWNSDLKNIASEKLIDELRLMLDVSSPMYQFLIEAYDKAVSEGLINADDYRR